RSRNSSVSPSHVFGPLLRSRELLCPRLTSASSSHRLATAPAHGQADRSPRVGRIHLHACGPPHLRHDGPCRYRTLKMFAFSSRPAASSAIPVRRASLLPPGFLRIPPHDRHPCLRLTSPPAGFVRDLHPQVNTPCRAHKQKAGRFRPARVCYWDKGGRIGARLSTSAASAAPLSACVKRAEMVSP